MKKVILFYLIILLSCQSCLAFDLDMTVDDDIRKNYNSGKLQHDMHTEDTNELLPTLPDISKYNESAKNEAQQSVKEEINIPAKEPDYTVPKALSGNIKIRKGTVINVVNSTKVNDWLAKGNTIKFYTKEPLVKKKYTIPANTVFYGEIIETHQPQITCNGGLVVIRVKKMIYKGQTVPINAYITRANDKMIFLNNIKGNRTYLKTTYQKGNWGRTMFNKMMTMTINLGGDGSTILLSPFPFAYGTICIGLNTLTSPICAFFSKGGHVSIPTGSQFKIKLLEDTFVN